MMQETETAARVYNALLVLRECCFDLMPDRRDPNVKRLLSDIGDQHARQASEVAVVLSDLWAAQGLRAQAAGGTVGLIVAPPDFSGPASRPEVGIFPGLIQAEEGLLAAYDAAIAQQPDGSALLAVLSRHRVAIATSLQRLQALGL